MFITIITGVVVFVISQYFLKIFIEPIVSLKSTLGKISALFLREQRKITNADATTDTQEKIWSLTASLMAKSTAIPFYKRISFVVNLPSEKSIDSACGSLNWIAYNIVKSENADFGKIIQHMEKIGSELNIKTEYAPALHKFS
jgi:hypothetical protein